MTKFRLTWIEKVTYGVEVEANTEEKAREMFEDNDLGCNIKEDNYDFIEDSLEVNEVEE